MVARIVRYALTHRLLTLFLVGLASIWGGLAYLAMPKDIYPDLNAPLVNIITENPGMASEDVERLITFPLESLLAGAPGVTRVRSESTTGSSVVTVEFDWGLDIYRARQIVSSKLEQVAGRLPQGTTTPILGPVSSRMGEVFEFAVVGDGTTDPMTLRSVADWTIRYQLQGVPGISFVINLGGFVRQFQVLLDPLMLGHYGITVHDVLDAIEHSNRNFSGGVITKPSQEVLVKGLGRIETLDHLRDTVITSRAGVPVCVRDVAEVRVGPQFRREAASFNGGEAVCVTVEKQYGGDTLAAIANVKAALARIGRDLPEGIAIRPYLRPVGAHPQVARPCPDRHPGGRRLHRHRDGAVPVGRTERADRVPDDSVLDPDRARADGARGHQPDRHVHRRARHWHRQGGQRLHHHGGEHPPGPARAARRGPGAGPHLRRGPRRRGLPGLGECDPDPGVPAAAGAGWARGRDVQTDRVRRRCGAAGVARAEPVAPARARVVLPLPVRPRPPQSGDRRAGALVSRPAPEGAPAQVAAGGRLREPHRPRGRRVPSPRQGVRAAARRRRHSRVHGHAAGNVAGGVDRDGTARRGGLPVVSGGDRRGAHHGRLGSLRARPPGEPQPLQPPARAGGGARTQRQGAGVGHAGAAGPAAGHRLHPRAADLEPPGRDADRHRGQPLRQAVRPRSGRAQRPDPRGVHGPLGDRRRRRPADRADGGHSPAGHPARSPAARAPRHSRGAGRRDDRDGPQRD